ncbi:hypothetical protein ACHAC9_22295 [Massilia sp. CMS3.1]|uniref:hypothetical protein n=1 Tax=Massilia sp. CMS3.1 TaxID=3373083 RepID=UPI003EE5EBA2
MTDFYVSPSGLDTNDGLSWATAKQTFNGVMALATAAGDRVLVDKALVDNQTVTRSYAGGTLYNPLTICSVDNGTTVPGEVSKGGQLLTTGAIHISFSGSVNVHGLTIAPGNAGNAATLNMGNQTSPSVLQTYTDCALGLYHGGTNASARVNIGSQSPSNLARSLIVWNNCTLKLGSTQQYLEIGQDFIWRGGAIVPPTAPVGVMRVGYQGRGSSVLVEGVDFSALQSTSHLVFNSSTGQVIFRNCVLPTNWTGQPVSADIADPGLRVELHNCDSADTNYRLWIVAANGSIRSETGTYRQGGASDGVTPFSLKMATNGNATPGLVGLESPEITAWSNVVDAPITLSLEIVCGVTILGNSDIWLEVQHLGTSGVPKSSFVNNRVKPLATSAYHLGSTEGWTNPDALTMYKQRLSVTVTPRELGALQLRVVLGRPNTTVFIDPKVQVT